MTVFVTQTHMSSSDEDELHKMAQLIGIRRKFMVGKRYPIDAEKREMAISEGAKEKQPPKNKSK